MSTVLRPYQTIIAVHVVTTYLQQYPNLARKIKLVTLGQCIPLIDGVPQAELFHQHLIFLENQKSIIWADYVARADSLAFCCNEQKIRQNDINQPNVCIVRFFNGFVNKRYQAIKRNKLRLHFQYLMATEIPTEYDFFRMTAGPISLQ